MRSRNLILSIASLSFMVSGCLVEVTAPKDEGEDDATGETTAPGEGDSTGDGTTDGTTGGGSEGQINAGWSSFNYIDCGQTEGAGLTASRDATAPTAAPIGKWVNGRLDPDDPAAANEYWSFELPAGDYLMVLETERSDGKHSNTGATVYLTDSDGAKGERVLNINEIGFDGRNAKLYPLASNTTLTLRVDASFAVQDYRLGFFRPEDGLAVPRFANCPQVQELQLGQTYTFERVADRTRENSEFYLIGNLPAGDYSVVTKASRIDGDDSNVGADVHFLNEVAAEDDEKRIVDINEIDFSAQETGKLPLAKDQRVVLRISPSFGENMVEVTINQE